MARRKIVDISICQSQSSVNHSVIIALADDGTSYWMQPTDFGKGEKDDHWKRMPTLPDSMEVVQKEEFKVPDPFAK